MNILSLDLGTNLGFCLANLKPDAQIASVLRHGSISLKGKKKDHKGEPLAKFKYFLEAFSPLPKLIVYEKVYAHRGVLSSHMYGAYEGVLKLHCAQNEIELVEIGVGEWKKEFGGKGNANKKEIMEFVVKAGYNVSSQDEADAIGVMHGYLFKEKL